MRKLALVTKAAFTVISKFGAQNIGFDIDVGGLVLGLWGEADEIVPWCICQSRSEGGLVEVSGLLAWHRRDEWS